MNVVDLVLTGDDRKSLDLQLLFTGSFMRLITVLVLAVFAGSIAGMLHSQWNLSGIREQLRPINPGSVSQFVGKLETAKSASIDGPIAVVVGSTEYDFGTMERRGVRTHTFVIRNDGTKPLTLEKGETTCKCTLSSLASDEIEPGDSVEVRLEWTAREVGPSLRFAQTADIITNDPNNRTIQLVVKGQIVQSVMPRPDVLTMNGLSSGEGITVKGKIFTYKEVEEPLQIVEVVFLEDTPEELIEITFVELTEEEVKEELRAYSGLEMTVKLAAGLPPGSFSFPVRLTTNLPDAPKVDVFLNGSVATDITIFGKGYRSFRESGSQHIGVLDLEPVSSEQGFETSINLVVKGAYREKVEFAVKEVEPASHLELSLGEPAPIGNGKTFHHRLTIKIQPGAKQISRRGGNLGMPARIVLSSTHPFVKEVSLEVLMSVTK